MIPDAHLDQFELVGIAVHCTMLIYSLVFLRGVLRGGGEESLGAAVAAIAGSFCTTAGAPTQLQVVGGLHPLVQLHRTRCVTLLTTSYAI